jgi:hypothetical protein
VSTSTCPRCGARYRDDHECDDVVALYRLQTALENNTDRLDVLADKLDALVAALTKGPAR